MFYNARWYDSLTGRFAQADTIVPGGVQGLDRYAYANNNPLYYTDPSGHFAIVPFAITMAVIVGVWMIAAPPAYAPSSDADLAARITAAESNPSYQAAEWIDEHPIEFVVLVAVAVHTSVEAVAALAEATDQAVDTDPTLDEFFEPADYPSNEPGKTTDPLTGEEVGRFISQPDGNTLIEPKGGSTTSSPDGRYVQTHYPDGTDYQRYDGVPDNPHGHGYNQYGEPIDIYGNPVKPNSPGAHWYIPK
jgi:hypothetical protein